MKFTIILLLIPISLLAAAREVELVEVFQPKLGDSGGDIYIPMPQSGLDYQKLLSKEIQGNSTYSKIEKLKVDNRNENDVEVLHAHWDHPADAKLSVTLKLHLEDRESPMKDLGNNRFFLRPTEHVQTDGIVLQTAQKITKGISDPDKKAQAIYNWVVDNTLRDPSTRGCGFGDVKSLLQSGNLKGKCADLNSLFVGLARASGIPAREIFGLRVASGQWNPVLGKEGDVSKAQHCRAEYYSANQKAWVAVDPADIQKLILDGKLAKNDPEIQRMRERLFGHWEGNWVGFNFGRDFQLAPNSKRLNYFMYPQLVSQTSPDGMDPSEVAYTFTSREILPVDKNTSKE